MNCPDTHALAEWITITENEKLRNKNQTMKTNIINLFLVPARAHFAGASRREQTDPSPRPSPLLYVFSAERGHSCPQQRDTRNGGSESRPYWSLEAAADKNVRAPLNRYPLRKGRGRPMPGVVPARCALSALVAGLGLMPVGQLTAQPAINFEGANPNAGLILSNNTLYGTAAAAGSSGAGTVFAVNTDGTGFRILHSFTYGSDGANPWDGLILSSNILYGTAYNGGSSGYGNVFAVNTDGAGFTNLYSFTGGSGGANPIGGVILTNNTLYGTTRFGGSSGNGTAFSLPLPPLPPVARCKHVTVSADAGCSADASIDDGSFDPNAGGTITLVQTPSGPYPLGDTIVTLTVADNRGPSNSCVATVTVVDTTPPVIHCPGNMVSDATSPAGAVVSFALAASDNCSLASVTSRPASGGTCAIGDTTVTCTAADAAGNQAACTFTVHVKGAAEQIRSNIALVQRLGLQSGTANSLSAKLQASKSGLDRGNLEAACGNLGAILNEVNAQTGKKLTAVQAGLLIAEATRIRAVLGCN